MDHHHELEKSRRLLLWRREQATGSNHRGTNAAIIRLSGVYYQVLRLARSHPKAALQ